MTDENEQEYLTNLISKGSRQNYGLCGYYKNGWQWVTGELFWFENWDCYQPDRHKSAKGSEDYLMTYKIPNPVISSSQAYKWNDMYEDGIYPGEENFFTTDLYGFICEWEPEDEFW